MVLSAQQFAEVINHLRARAGLSLGSEKRRATRMELKSTIVIAPIVNGSCTGRVNVMTRDISIEGVGLLTAVPLAEEQQFIALLPRSDTQTIVVLTRIMHRSVVADGMFSLGCRFLQVLTSQAAEKLQTPDPADVQRIRNSVLK